MLSALRRRISFAGPGPAAAADMFIDSYVEWRERACSAERVYSDWALAVTAQERATAFSAFSSALDEEEQAAHQFRETIRSASEILAAHVR